MTATDTITDTTIPQDYAAEQLLLGALLADGSLLLDLRGKLTPDDFFTVAHQAIARAIVAAAAQGDVSLLRVKNVLEQCGQLAKIGRGTDPRAGVDYLTHLLAECSFDTSNFGYYVERVRNTAALRALVSLGAEIAADAKESSVDDVADLLGKYQTRLFALDVGGDRRDGLVEIGAAVDAVIAHANLVRDGKVSAGLLTGFPAFDNASSGMQHGDLWVLGGGTSLGKTALGLAISANVARNGGAVLYCSLEMSQAAIVNRLLSSEARIAGLSLRSGNLSAEEETARTAAANAINGWQFGIEDGALTVPEIAARVRQLASRWRRELSLVVIDYVQLIAATGGETREQQVSQVVRGLKGLAMQTGTPILALSQINRQGATSTGPPSLHTLRESGDIENAANAVILLHRPSQPELDTGGAVILWSRIAKSRDGMVSPWPDDQGHGIRLRFLPACTRMEPLTL